MMPISHLLEDFETDPLAQDKVHLLTEDALEEHRLASFDQGYAAGWDDAVKAQSDRKTETAAALTRVLEDASFTYQEALAQVNAALEPMFHRLVETVLPRTLEQGFHQHVVEHLREMAREQTGQPTLLLVPQGAASALKPLLDREFAMPVQLVEENSMPPGQARLRIADAERAIDCDALLAAITAALDSFTHQAREATRNG